LKIQPENNFLVDEYMVTTFELDAKHKLKSSKERLSQALSQFEKILEISLNDTLSDESISLAIEELNKKIESLDQEKQHLKEKYNNLKLTSKEVLEELNTSIETIKTLVKNFNGNSQSYNP
jgi:chromosome segregation ATPase